MDANMGPQAQLVPVCMDMSPPPNPEEAYRQQQRWLKWTHSNSGHYIPDPVVFESPPWNDKTLGKEIRGAIHSSFADWKDPIHVLVDLKALRGSFNTAYMVQVTNRNWKGPRHFVFRLTLPMNPWYKVHSEVATMMYIRQHTTIPVARVYAFNSSTSNPLGFEWILMEKMAGQPCIRRAERLNKQVADYVSQLSSMQLPQNSTMIGSIFYQFNKQGDNAIVNNDHFIIGPLSRFPGIMKNRLRLSSVYRGPYRTLSQLFEFYLQLAIEDMKDEKRQEDLFNKLNPSKANPSLSLRIEEIRQQNAQMYRRYISHSLPSIKDQLAALESPSRLHHHDLHQGNILVDENGDVTAILDWENIAAIPLFLHWRYPTYLQGKEEKTVYCTTFTQYTQNAEELSRWSVRRISRALSKLEYQSKFRPGYGNVADRVLRICVREIAYSLELRPDYVKLKEIFRYVQQWKPSNKKEPPQPTAGELDARMKIFGQCLEEWRQQRQNLKRKGGG